MTQTFLVPIQMVNALLQDWEPIRWDATISSEGDGPGRRTAPVLVAAGWMPEADGGDRDPGQAAQPGVLVTSTDPDAWWGAGAGGAQGTGFMLFVSRPTDDETGTLSGYEFQGRYGSVLLDNSWVTVDEAESARIRAAIIGMLEQVGTECPNVWHIQSVARKLAERQVGPGSPREIQKCAEEIGYAESVADNAREHLEALTRQREELRRAGVDGARESAADLERDEAGGIPFETPFGETFVVAPSNSVKEIEGLADRVGLLGVQFHVTVRPAEGHIEVAGVLYEDFVFYSHRDPESMRWHGGVLMSYKGSRDASMPEHHRSHVLSGIVPACLERLNALPKDLFLDEEIRCTRELLAASEQRAAERQEQLNAMMSRDDVVPFTHDECLVLLSHPSAAVREHGLHFLNCPTTAVERLTPAAMSGSSSTMPHDKKASVRQPGRTR